MSIMKLTTETKILLGVIVGTVVILFGGIFFFSKPEPLLPKEELINSSSHTTGNPSAKVYLVEFSDFQCPACKSFEPTIEMIINKHKDNLLFAFRHFPLDQHAFAQKAAFAVEAAAQQGKFWEMHNLLFQNQEKFSDSIFLELAEELKLDKEKFSTATNDSAIKDKVIADMLYGQKIGVDATPTFYLNGKKMYLTSAADLTKQVDDAIASNK